MDNFEVLRQELMVVAALMEAPGPLSDEVRSWIAEAMVRNANFLLQ